MGNPVRRPVRRGAKGRERRAAHAHRRVPREHPHSEGIASSAYTPHAHRIIASGNFFRSIRRGSSDYSMASFKF